jgi:hypothetical protein
VLIATEEGRCFVSQGGTAERAGSGEPTSADYPPRVLTELRRRAQQITTLDFNHRIHGWEDSIEALIVDALRRSYADGLEAAPIVQFAAEAPERKAGQLAAKEAQPARPASSLRPSGTSRR